MAKMRWAAARHASLDWTGRHEPHQGWVPYDVPLFPPEGDAAAEGLSYMEKHPPYGESHVAYGAVPSPGGSAHGWVLLHHGLHVGDEAGPPPAPPHPRKTMTMFDFMDWAKQRYTNKPDGAPKSVGGDHELSESGTGTSFLGYYPDLDSAGQAADWHFSTTYGAAPRPGANYYDEMMGDRDDLGDEDYGDIFGDGVK